MITEAGIPGVDKHAVCEAMIPSRNDEMHSTTLTIIYSKRTCVLANSKRHNLVFWNKCDVFCGPRKYTNNAFILIFILCIHFSLEVVWQDVRPLCTDDQYDQHTLF